MTPYSFTDRDGNYLTISPAHDCRAATLTVTDARTRQRVTITVPAWRLGDLVAAEYRAAGETVPMLVNPDEVADDWVRHPGRGAA